MGSLASEFAMDIIKSNKLPKFIVEAASRFVPKENLESLLPEIQTLINPKIGERIPYLSQSTLQTFLAIATDKENYQLIAGENRDDLEDTFMLIIKQPGRNISVNVVKGKPDVIKSHEYKSSVYLPSLHTVTELEYARDGRIKKRTSKYNRYNRSYTNVWEFVTIPNEPNGLNQEGAVMMHSYEYNLEEAQIFRIYDLRTLKDTIPDDKHIYGGFTIRMLELKYPKMHFYDLNLKLSKINENTVQRIE